MRILFERIKAETPTWFKSIAWVAGVVALVSSALILGSNSGNITLSAFELEWLKRIDIVAVAVASVAITAKK